jgi:hypothetical protein
LHPARTRAKIVNVNEKERYEKPELEVIELQPNEVLAVGCKTTAGANVLGPPNCGSGSSCVEVGS